jgi:hypothetical protein
MQDARYLRSQAELCLRMARDITDDKLAAKFSAAATQYFLRAVDAEPLRGDTEPFRGDICANRFENWPKTSNGQRLTAKE